MVTRDVARWGVRATQRGDLPLAWPIEVALLIIIGVVVLVAVWACLVGTAAVWLWRAVKR